jgi:hypothetical protein
MRLEQFQVYILSMATRTDTMVALLRHAIDYAGLFPPAQLDMPGAVERFARYRDGSDAWALGRFIVTSGRLDEFEGAAAAVLPREQDADPWPIALLSGRDPAHDAELIFNFNERHAKAAPGRAVIDTLEARASDLTELELRVRSAPADVPVYVELPWQDDPTDAIAALANLGARAKIRTGGTAADAFPPPRAVARFIRVCVDQAVSFKATAGLHHPLRGEHRLTYEPGSAEGTMYGHLNLLVAAALADQGLSLEELEAVLVEREVEAFSFDADGVGWRHFRADRATIDRVRSRVAISFGSCSFTEPLDDLRALGLL